MAQALNNICQVRQNNKTMKSSRVNTKYNNRSWVRNISAALALMLAGVTLLQAGNATSKEAEISMTTMEAEIIAEIDHMLIEEELSLEELVLIEVEEEMSIEVNIYDDNNELIAAGNPEFDSELRKLMNSADYLSELGNQQYFKISK